MLIQENKEKRYAGFCLFAFLLGLASTSLVLFVNVFEGGGAAFMVGIWIALSSLLLYRFFRRRARVLDDMIGEIGVLAHWQYDSGFMAKERQELTADQKMIKVMGMVMGSIFWVIGLVAFLSNPDKMGLFALFMGMVGGLLFGVARWRAWALSRTDIYQPAEAVFTANGAYYDGQLMVWGRRPRSISIISANKTGVQRLQLRTGGHRNRQSMDIPIPPGEEARARQLEQRFRGDTQAED